MNKLKETVLRLSTVRYPSLSASQIEDRFDSLFNSSSASIYTPTHPPYSHMIVAAIRDLNEKDGSEESSVSSFIQSREQDLPIAHAHLLAHHLKKLVEGGEIIFNSKSRYQLPNSNPNNHETEQQKQRKRPKSRRGVRCNTKSDSEVQLAMRGDEVIMSVGDGEIGGDVSYPVDVDGFENSNPSPERKRQSRICVGWNEERYELEQQEEEQGMLVRDEMVSGMVDRFVVSPQLQLNNAIETEVLDNANVQNDLMTQWEKVQMGNQEEFMMNHGLEQHGEQELVVKDQRVVSTCDSNGCIRSSRLELMPMIEMEPFESLTEQNELRKQQEKVHMGYQEDYTMNDWLTQHGEQGLVVKDHRVVSISNFNGCIRPSQLELMPMIEMEPLGSSNEQNELLKKQEKTETGNQEVSMMNDGLQQHGEQELVVKDQMVVSICDSNGCIEPSKLESITVIEKESSQSLNEPNEPLLSQQQELEEEKERDNHGMRNNEGERHGDHQLVVKDKAITSTCADNGFAVLPELQPTTVIDMELLQDSGQNEQPVLQQQHQLVAEEKKKRGRLGRPKKKRKTEKDEEQALVLKDHTITSIDSDNGLVVAHAIEMVPLENPSPQKELKKKDARGEPTICPLSAGDIDNAVMVPHNEQQQMVKKKDGRGRPKKVQALGVIDNGGMVPQNEQQQTVKKVGRGRPKKIHALAVGDIDNDMMMPQNAEQQMLKKKTGRGRPKKKKQEPEQEGETQFVLQKETRSSVDDHGLNSSLSFHSLPLDINDVMVPQNAQQQILKKKGGRGRPKKKKQEPEQEGEQPFVVIQNETRCSVDDHGLNTSPSFHSLSLDIDDDAMLPQTAQQQILKKKGSRGRPRKKKQELEQEGEKQFVIQKETRSSVDDHGLNCSPSLHSLSLSQFWHLLNPSLKQEQQLGGLSRGTCMNNKQGLEQPVLVMVLPNSNTHGVLENMKQSQNLSLQQEGEGKKHGRGRPKKNKQDKLLAVFPKSQLTVEEELASAKAAEKVKQPLAIELEQLQQQQQQNMVAIELEPSQEQQQQQQHNMEAIVPEPSQQQQLEKRMKPQRKVDWVDDKCVPPPKKKNRKTILKYMQEPQLPRRQLRPRPLIKALAEERQEEQTQNSEPYRLQPSTDGDILKA